MKVLFFAILLLIQGKMEGQPYEYGNIDQYEDVNIWYGPGWYNGIWFGSEEEFDAWHEQNPTEEFEPQ